MPARAAAARERFLLPGGARVRGSAGQNSGRTGSVRLACPSSELNGLDLPLSDREYHADVCRYNAQDAATVVGAHGANLHLGGDVLASARHGGSTRWSASKWS